MPQADTVTVRYWAAARAAAGCDSDLVTPGTLEQVLTQVRERHGERFAQVVKLCSVLVGDRPVGTRDHAGVQVEAGDVVELLPPFAGG